MRKCFEEVTFQQRPGGGAEVGPVRFRAVTARPTLEWVRGGREAGEAWILPSPWDAQGPLSYVSHCRHHGDHLSPSSRPAAGCRHGQSSEPHQLGSQPTPGAPGESQAARARGRLTVATEEGHSSAALPSQTVPALPSPPHPASLKVPPVKRFQLCGV